MLYLEQFYFGWVPDNFLRMHVSEDKACWKDLCWFVGVVFTLRSEEWLTWSCCRRCREILSPDIRCQILIYTLAWVVTNGIKWVLLLVKCGLWTNQGRNWWTCDTRVKEGSTNKPRPYSNESDIEDRMAKP